MGLALVPPTWASLRVRGPTDLPAAISLVLGLARLYGIGVTECDVGCAVTPCRPKRACGVGQGVG
ncbi:hypothetical protein FAIPA1_40282 [Frankia sp. AiPs1]